jgi:hypothetical protein
LLLVLLVALRTRNILQAFMPTAAP